MNLLPLHGLAAANGDGLHPKLLELLESRNRRATANVEELAMHRDEPHMQAGPNPAGPPTVEPSERVVPFPASAGRQPVSRRASAAS